jgi:hypothetical protein
MAITINGKDYPSFGTFAKNGLGSYTKSVAAAQIQEYREKLDCAGKQQVKFAPLYIGVHFHHILGANSPQTFENLRTGQIEVLNRAFRPLQITFVEASSVTYDGDYDLAYRMDVSSVEERDLKFDLHRDVHRSLNLYTAGLTEGILSWSTLPEDRAGDPEMDGVVIQEGSMPGSYLPGPLNDGRVAVAEVMRWLGLHPELRHPSQKKPHSDLACIHFMIDLYRPELYVASILRQMLLVEVSG